MSTTPTRKETSLFPGRFQPFHAGHAAIIRQLKMEGRDVVVAVRTQDVQTANPYAFPQVMRQVTDVFPNTQVIMLPPFDEIVHGREPGWTVREIEVIEPISATALRGGAVIWITGQSGSGKTSLADELKKMYLPSAIILDGDEMRKTISTNEGFSDLDRKEHNLRVARLADVMQSQGHIVIVSVIAPFIETRVEIGDALSPIWFHLPGASAEAINEEWPYEVPASHEPIRTLHTENARPAEVAEEAWTWISMELGA